MTDFKFEIGEKVIITNINNTMLHGGCITDLKKIFIGKVRKIRRRQNVITNRYRLDNIINNSLPWWFDESELGRIYEEEYDGLHIKQIIDKVYGQKIEEY